jgi:hypothetical protein
MSEYLTAEDIHALTGYARPGKQAMWLRDKGIPHRVDGLRVIICTTHCRNWLEGVTMIRSNGLNLAAIK